MATIKYLHLTDLHIGDKLQKGLISQTKKILFDDIEFILSKLQGLDVVFFTGDFVQKGTKEEFSILEEFLNEMWQLFGKYQYNPYLLCVPGNHDVERVVDLNHPVQKILSNWNNDNIKDEYFWITPNPYHDFIFDRFKNYTEWYQNTKIRKPKIIEGCLPGDFYCSLQIEGVLLGVVGLNSTFLQLSGGDYKHKLGIYNKQINALFDESYFEWSDKQNLSILLTHHSPEWFEPKSLSEFNQEIYCHDNFVEHLCGHMHEPNYSATSINGFSARRHFIGPSLFGIESFDNHTSRIHGYTAGLYNVEMGSVTKTIWPRISLKTSVGLKITQNEEFNLEKDTASLTETLKNTKKETLDEREQQEENTKSLSSKGENLFAKEIILDKGKGLARTIYKEFPAHKGIRHTERNSIIKGLKDLNYCWIATAFGLGESEFVGSILDEANINFENCFSINCDEVTNLDELIESFKSTFSLNITQFFDIVNSLDRPLLVFNHINDDLIKEASKLKGLIQTVFDFSPNTKILIISEAPPEQHIEFIQLLPLDVPAVRHFIDGSQGLQSSFSVLELEKIHRISSGIPLYLEKVIDQLKFRPLSDLGDMEFENQSKKSGDILPKTLLNEIHLLRSDETKEGARRFSMLSILSLLHNGETFDRIRRYNQNHPFHPDDILYLLNNKFVETIKVNSIFEETNFDTEIKIIRVPRVVRDFVRSMLSDKEKLEIYYSACNLYLGKNWRTKIKLIQTKDTELDLIVHQNLQIAIRFILLDGIENKKGFEINRMTRISKSLIEYFSGRGAYKDAVSLTEETLLLIKDWDSNDIEKTRTYLMRKLGENLRMSSVFERSVSILKTICDDENNNLTKAELNDIRLSIAYAYESNNEEQEAIKYANLIKSDEQNKNSELYLCAESVIAHFIENTEEKLKKLRTIKNKAEKFGYRVLKANIILEICSNTTDESQIKLLDKTILESKDDTYTKVRAFIAKANIVLNSKDVDKISEEDLWGLNVSYSYSFYQRLHKLLNICHRLAWQYWSKQKKFDQLLNLFRYSSFVWRLCGETEIERKYIDELHFNAEFIEWFKSSKNDINSTYYEQRIFAFYNYGNIVQISD